MDFVEVDDDANEFITADVYKKKALLLKVIMNVDIIKL